MHRASENTPGTPSATSREQATCTAVGASHSGQSTCSSGSGGAPESMATGLIVRRSAALAKAPRPGIGAWQARRVGEAVRGSRNGRQHPADAQAASLGGGGRPWGLCSRAASPPGSGLVGVALEPLEGLAALLPRLGRLALALDRRLLVVGPPLHLLEDAVLQHLLLELLQRGLDLIVEDLDLHSAPSQVSGRSKGADRLGIVDDVHLHEPFRPLRHGAGDRPEGFARFLDDLARVVDDAPAPVRLPRVRERYDLHRGLAPVIGHSPPGNDLPPLTTPPETRKRAPEIVVW